MSRLFDANNRLSEENMSLQTKLEEVSAKLDVTLQEKEEDLLRLLDVNNRLSEENNSLQQEFPHKLRSLRLNLQEKEEKLTRLGETNQSLLDENRAQQTQLGDDAAQQQASMSRAVEQK